MQSATILILNVIQLTKFNTMKFFTVPYIILLLVFLSFHSYSQTNRAYNNNKFEWYFEKECWPKNAQIEIFKVIETPPLLYGITQRQFKTEIKKIIRKNNHNSIKDTEFKIQIYSLVNSGVCVKGISVINGTNEELIKQIFQYIKKLDNIEIGRQRGIEKNCLSEIYIKTKRKKLRDIKFSNLKFEK